MSDLEKLFDSHTHNFDTGNRGIVQLISPLPVDLPAYFSFGIHPKEYARDLNEIEQICQKLNCEKGFLAIGEIGLDNRYGNLEQQEQLFIFQLKIARRLQKPVILHCVNSWDRCRFLHEKHAPETFLIYHGFNKSSILESVLSYPQAIVSIGESLLTNSKLKNTLKSIPADRLLLETDMGERELIDTYHAVAEIKKLSLPALTEQLDQNAKRIFKYE